ncbi:MAG: hypothetical protein IPK50_04885 [Fibrobacterota bacterium]|nr:MAG: hypothetical protein IPK50_04885 [Fibrobacterota bacterium]
MRPVCRWGWVLVAASLVALLGCGSSPSAGGSSVETEELRAMVTLSDGSPASGATVLLRPANYLSAQTGRSMATNSVQNAVCGPDGRVVFPGVERGEYVLEARTATGTAAARVGRDPSGSETRLVGRDTASLQGFVATNGSPAWVVVRGLERGVWADSTGKFRFERVPTGDWEAVALGEQSPVAWGKVRMDGQSPTRIVLLDSALWKRLFGIGGLVLEDFESDSDRPSIGALSRRMYWYYSSDSSEGGATFSNPRLPHTGLGSAIVAGSGPDGSKAAHVRFTLDPLRDSPYAQIGLTSSEGGVFLDFSGFDSLVLQAKGTGRIRIDLPSQDVSVAKPGCHDAWGVDLELPGDWTRIAIRRQDLTLAAGSCASGSNLEKALSGVDEIRLKVLSDAELWFDDLRIHGVEANQF